MKKLLLFVVVLVAGGFVLQYFVQHPNLNQSYRLNTAGMYDRVRDRVTGAQTPIIDDMLPGNGELTFEIPTVHHGRHQAVTTAECHMPAIRMVTTETNARIYHWTDETGLNHFSDRPPPGVSAAAYNPALPARAQYFQLNIDHVGMRQVPFIRDQLDVSVRKTFQILSELLGHERLRQVDLNLRIFAEHEDYREYARSQGAFRSADAGGYYSHRHNEAVTFQYPDDRTTLEVARHEAVHVIVAGLMGVNTPLWLNEGLAVYFEKLHVAGQYAEITTNHDMINLARHAVSNGYPQQLMSYLRLDRDTWYGEAATVHYALGYSLVHFLMESADGRRALSALIRYKADNYCDSVDQARRLSYAYPGGASALQLDFFRWIRDPAPKASHHY